MLQRQDSLQFWENDLLPFSIEKKINYRQALMARFLFGFDLDISNHCSYNRNYLTRGGEVRYLVGLITRRSQVQILPPLPNVATKARSKDRAFFASGPCHTQRALTLPQPYHLRSIVPCHCHAVVQRRRFGNLPQRPPNHYIYFVNIAWGWRCHTQRALR